MNPIVWAAGKLVDPSQAVVTAIDHGVTVGDGVFETLTVRDGKPFAITRHLQRLKYSAERIGLRAPDPDYLSQGVRAVMEAGGGALTRLRVTVTSGEGPMGTVRGEGPLTVTVMGVTGARPRVCHAVRSPWVRNERSALAGVKSTSYGDNVMMAAYARSKGADEAIVANTRGHLCEGTTTNVFVERDGEILTPPLSSGCLPGVTRGLALEWGAEAGIPIRVSAPGELTMDVLDEVVAAQAHLAVTSSTRGVQHLSSLDGHELAAGHLLRKLSALFELNAEKYPDPQPRRAG